MNETAIRYFVSIISRALSIKCSSDIIDSFCDKYKNKVMTYDELYKSIESDLVLVNN